MMARWQVIACLFASTQSCTSACLPNYDLFIPSEQAPELSLQYIKGARDWPFLLSTPGRFPNWQPSSSSFLPRSPAKSKVAASRRKSKFGVQLLAHSHTHMRFRKVDMGQCACCCPLVVVQTAQKHGAKAGMLAIGRIRVVTR